MDDEERFMSITEISIKWLLKCVEALKQQQDGWAFTCQTPSPNLWCSLEPSTTVGKAAFDWTERLLLALNNALQISSVCEELLDFVCRSVALNGDLGLLLMQQLKRRLAGDPAWDRAGSASVNVADGQVEGRPPMKPTVADLALAAYMFFASPADFGGAALQLVAMVISLSSPKELSSWVATYSSKGLSPLTDWLLEVALGWLASPFNMDAADISDGTRPNVLDEGTSVKRQLFDIRTNANTAAVAGPRASAPCREPWPRMRCGAILLAALCWSCRPIARHVITETLDRLCAAEAGDGSAEQLEGYASPAVEGIGYMAAAAAAATPLRGLHGDICDHGGGIGVKWRPEWQVLRSITTDMARIMALRYRVCAEKHSVAPGEPVIDKNKAVRMLSELCGEDVGFYEHLLCHSVELLIILEEFAAFLPAMEHTIARRFLSVVAPLLPHSEPLIETLLLDAVRMASEAADAAAVEDAAMEAAAAAAARHGGKVLTHEGFTSPPTKCPLLPGAATLALKSYCPAGNASLMSTPCASHQAHSEYSLGSVLRDSPEGPSMSSAAWLLHQLQPQATNAKAVSMLTGDGNDAALAAKGDAGPLPTPVALALEVLCVIITHANLVPFRLVPFAKKLLDGLLGLASRCSSSTPRAACYMRFYNGFAEADTGTVQNRPRASAESGLSAGLLLLPGEPSRRILFRLQTALMAASRPDGVTRAYGPTDGTDLSLLSLHALAASLQSCLQRGTHDDQSNTVRSRSLPSNGADELGRCHTMQVVCERVNLESTSAAASLQPAAPAACPRRLCHCLRWRLAHKSASSNRRDAFGGSNAQLPENSGNLAVGRERGASETDGKNNVEFALATQPIAMLIVALGQALVALRWSSLRAERGSHGEDVQLCSPATRDQLSEHVGLMAELLVLAVFGDDDSSVVTPQKHCGYTAGRQRQLLGQMDAEAAAVLQLRMQVLAALIEVLAKAPEGLSLDILRATEPLLPRPPPQQARQEGAPPGVLRPTSDPAEVPGRGPGGLGSDGAAGDGAKLSAAQSAVHKALSLARVCVRKHDSTVQAKQPSFDRTMGPHAGTAAEQPKSAQSCHKDVEVAAQRALNNIAQVDAADSSGDERSAISTALIGLLSCHAALHGELQRMDASPRADGAEMHIERQKRGKTPSQAADTVFTAAGTAGSPVSVNIRPSCATQHDNEAEARAKPSRGLLSATGKPGDRLRLESVKCNDHVVSARGKRVGDSFFVRGNPGDIWAAWRAATPAANRDGATLPSYSQPLPASIPVTSPSVAAVERPILDTWPVSLQASTELLQRLLQLSANSQSRMCPALQLQRWQLISYTAAEAHHLIHAGCLEAPTQLQTGTASDHGNCRAVGVVSILAALGGTAVDIAREVRAGQYADLANGRGSGAVAVHVGTRSPAAGTDRPGLTQGCNEQRHLAGASTPCGKAVIMQAGMRSGTESETQQDTLSALPRARKPKRDIKVLTASLSKFPNFEILDLSGGRRSRRSCNDRGRVDGGGSPNCSMDRRGARNHKPTSLEPPKCGSRQPAAAAAGTDEDVPVTVQTVVAAAPPARAPVSVSQTQCWKSEIICSANQARIEALQLLAAVICNTVAWQPSMSSTRAISTRQSSAAELVAACSMLLPAPQLVAGPGVSTSEGNAAVSCDAPGSVGAMPLLQPLLQRLYPPTAVEDAVRDGLLVVCPDEGPTLLQTVQLLTRERPLEALALCLLEEVWGLLHGREGEPDLSQQHTAQTHRAWQRGRLIPPPGSAPHEVPGRLTLSTMQEDVQKHVKVGKLVDALVAVAAALPVSTDYTSPGHEALVDAITEICSRVLLKKCPVAASTRDSAASARASAKDGDAIFSAQTACLLARMACMTSECDRVLAISAQLLLALPNVLGKLEAHGGGLIREAKESGGLELASSLAPPQLQSPRWLRICPYALAAACRLAGTHARTSPAQGDINNNRNGGSGGDPAAFGTATDAVPSWLQNSSSVQIAQVLLEFSTAVLPTVLMVAALSGCRAEVDAEVSSFDNGDFEELQVEGLPDSVATILACCLQAIALLMLPCHAATSANVLSTRATMAHGVNGAKLIAAVGDDTDKRHRLLVEALCQLRCVASCAVTCTWLLVRRVSAGSAALSDAVIGRNDASADAAQDKACFKALMSIASNVTTEGTSDAAEVTNLSMVTSLWRYHSKRVAALCDQYRSRTLRRQIRSLKLSANGWQIVWDRLITCLEDALIRAPTSSLAKMHGRRCNSGRRGNKAMAAAPGSSLHGPSLEVARTLRKALIIVHGCAAEGEAYPASPPSCSSSTWAQLMPMHETQPHGRTQNGVSPTRPNYTSEMLNPAGHAAGDAGLGRREGLQTPQRQQGASEQGLPSPLTARGDDNHDEIPDEPMFLLFGHLNSDDVDDNQGSQVVTLPSRQAHDAAAEALAAQSAEKPRRRVVPSRVKIVQNGHEDGGAEAGMAAKDPVVGRKRPGRQLSSNPKTKAAAAAAPAVRGRQRKRVKERTSRNPYLAACLKETEGRHSDTDCSWSELEDFIVCQPGRDYGKLLAKKYHYPVDEWADISEDAED